MTRPDARGLHATTGATPLYAAALLAIDTETTGLDPVSARIVEIAALRVSASKVEPEPPLVSRVRPDVPIPPRSTAIHHITDDLVSSAPNFGALLPRLTALLEGRVAVGHAIGFDLAVIATEARRAGKSWHGPRALDVRSLAMIVAPHLASHSLDGLAAWLGLEITNRHSALGDAEAAASIFIELLPQLERRGIVTVAQAERAIRHHSVARETPMLGGWQFHRDDPPAPMVALSGTDSFPFRHTVSDVMASGVQIVAADSPLRRAMELMVAHNVSSVLVASEPVLAQPTTGYGILTERDILRSLATDGPQVLERPAGEMASRPLHTVRADAFVYRAVGRLARLRIRHLGVRNDAGLLVGVVAARDLLQAQSGPAVILDDAIEGAASGRDLAVAWSTLPAVTVALLGDGIDSRVVSRIVSEELQAMTRRACVMAEDAMRVAGRGGPPTPYAIMVLGSGGRSESLLGPDQDNALVFDAPGEIGSEGGETDRWFADYSVRFTDLLNESGIPLCRGGVMARNALWRGSLETWHGRIGQWVDRSRPADLLNVDIFFDMMPVHGDIVLGQQLFARAYAMAASNDTFAKLLGEAIPASEPLTLLGNLRLEDGRIDLKRYGLFPIVALARTLAIRHGLAIRPTIDRLGALGAKTGAGTALDALARSHQTLSAALLRQQGRDIEQGLPPGNMLDPSWLPKADLRSIRDALRHASSAHELVRDLMFK